MKSSLKIKLEVISKKIDDGGKLSEEEALFLLEIAVAHLGLIADVWEAIELDFLKCKKADYQCVACAIHNKLKHHDLEYEDFGI